MTAEVTWAIAFGVVGIFLTIVMIVQGCARFHSKVSDVEAQTDNRAGEPARTDNGHGDTILASSGQALSNHPTTLIHVVASAPVPTPGQGGLADQSETELRRCPDVEEATRSNAQSHQATLPSQQRMPDPTAGGGVAATPQMSAQHSVPNHHPSVLHVTGPQPLHVAIDGMDDPAKEPTIGHKEVEARTHSPPRHGTSEPKQE